MDTTTGAKIAMRISTTMKTSATIATLSRAQAPPEQLHRRARGDGALAGLVRDDDRVDVVGLDQAGRIAGAHVSASALRAALKMM